MDHSLSGSSVHGFSREEHWSGLPFPSPGDLPDPGIKPRSPALQTDSLLTELHGKPQILQYFHSIQSITFLNLFKVDSQLCRIISGEGKEED